MLSNISAPDAFGAGGPGTSPDFVGDDFVRVVAAKDDGSLFAFSRPFRIRQGRTHFVSTLAFTDTPPPLPVAIQLSVPQPTVAIGGSTPAQVEATLADGTVQDVTSASSWTTYRTSNSVIAVINSNGLVTGRGVGTALITAINDGATSVAQIVVTTPRDPLSTVVGVIQLEDGTPVVDASCSLIGLPSTSSSGTQGQFSITDVPTVGYNTYDVRATANIGGSTFVATRPGVHAEPGGFSDAGIIVLHQIERVLVYGMPISNGGSTLAVVNALQARGYDVVYSSVLPDDDLSQYDVIWHFNTSTGMLPAERDRLINYLQSGHGLHLTGEWICCESTNDGIESVVNAVSINHYNVGGGGGNQPGPYTFNPNAAGSVAAFPNVLSSFARDGVGRITGVTPVPNENIFVTGAGGAIVGIVLDCANMTAGFGRVTVTMDGNWTTIAPNAPAICENIITFLTGASACQ